MFVLSPQLYFLYRPPAFSFNAAVPFSTVLKQLFFLQLQFLSCWSFPDLFAPLELSSPCFLFRCFITEIPDVLEAGHSFRPLFIATRQIIRQQCVSIPSRMDTVDGNSENPENTTETIIPAQEKVG